MPTECFRFFFCGFFLLWFCRWRSTGPATLAFMLLGRFCAGRLNFSRLKYPPRRWDLGPRAANVPFRTVLVRTTAAYSTARTESEQTAIGGKCNLFGLFSGLCPLLCFTRVINLKRKEGLGPVWALCGGNWTSHSSPKCHTKTRKAPNFSLTASPGTNYTCETLTRFFFGRKETKCGPFEWNLASIQ